MSFPDVLVAIEMAAERLFAIVQMKRKDLVQRNVPFELREGFAVRGGRAQIVAGCKEVAGVDTESEPVASNRFVDGLQLFHAAAQTCTLARGIFDRDFAAISGGGPERARESGCHVAKSLSFSLSAMRSGMQHDEFESQQ